MRGGCTDYATGPRDRIEKASRKDNWLVNTDVFVVPRYPDLPLRTFIPIYRRNVGVPAKGRVKTRTEVKGKINHLPRQ